MWAAPRDDRRLFTALLVALIALAWLALWVWGQSPYGRFLSHHSLDALRGNAALMLVFVAGWTLMVVAMMLPTSLPLVALFRTLVRGRPDRTRLTVLLIAGYLAVWTLFGVLVYCGDWILHGAVEQSTWVEAHVVPFIWAGTLLMAGLYQFTLLKYHCLKKSAARP
jgi:predicted metal-binding membrane protein